MVLHSFSLYSLMGPKFNSDFKRGAFEEKEVAYEEARFHKDMDDKDEF